jgi:hypothetical protein
VAFSFTKVLTMYQINHIWIYPFHLYFTSFQENWEYPQNTLPAFHIRTLHYSHVFLR